MLNTDLAQLDLPYNIDLVDNLVGLRKWHFSDTEWYSRLVADPDVMRLIGDGRPRTAKAAALEIESFQHEQKALGHSRWVGYVMKTGEPIGFIGFSIRRGEIDWGGRAFRKYWGTRYVVCSGIMALDLGLTYCDVQQAFAMTDKSNRSSLSFNAKLGFCECGEEICFNRHHIRQSISRDAYISMNRRTNLALLKRLSHVSLAPERPSRPYQAHRAPC